MVFDGIFHKTYERLTKKKKNPQIYRTAHNLNSHSQEYRLKHLLCHMISNVERCCGNHMVEYFHTVVTGFCPVLSQLVERGIFHRSKQKTRIAKYF